MVYSVEVERIFHSFSSITVEVEAANAKEARKRVIENLEADEYQEEFDSQSPEFEVVSPEDKIVSISRKLKGKDKA